MLNSGRRYWFLVFDSLKGLAAGSAVLAAIIWRRERAPWHLTLLDVGASQMGRQHAQPTHNRCTRAQGGGGDDASGREGVRTKFSADRQGPPTLKQAPQLETSEEEPVDAANPPRRGRRC